MTFAINVQGVFPSRARRGRDLAGGGGDDILAFINIFAFNFAPVGTRLCDGALLPISQNTAVFSLLGTNYGGNGVLTFGLPGEKSIYI